MNKISKEKLPDSVILFENGEIYAKSDAFFRIVRHLGPAYRLLFVFKVFPKKLLDRLYDWIASNRYQWFGKRDECVVIPNQR